MSYLKNQETMNMKLCLLQMFTYWTGYMMSTGSLNSPFSECVCVQDTLDGLMKNKLKKVSILHIFVFLETSL